jgi:hypothetical protein
MAQARENVSSGYRLTPVRDLRVRNWAGAGFLLISFVGVISFLWASNPSISIPFLYIVYIGITIYALRFAKVDIFSPLMFFIFFSFLGFGLKLPLLSLFPERAFFANPFYSPHFSYTASALGLAFAVFLIGYVAFIVGFRIVKRGIKVGISERPSHPLGLALLSAVLITASFYFRSRYLVGVPGFNVALIEHAGYIYYPLLYGAIIATGLAFYAALVRGSAFYTVIGLTLFGLYALSEMLLGWKGGAIHMALIMLMIYYYVSRYRVRSINCRVRRWVVGLFVLMIVGTVILYPVVSQYRYAILMPSGQVNIGFFGDILKASGSDALQALNSLIRRASGLDNLTAIVAYFQQGIGVNSATLPSFFSNLFGIGIPPEQFYTWHILGVNPNIITTNAPTGWGALYIYGGTIGIVIGMILIGMLSKFLYLAFLANIRRDGRWIVFYAIFINSIFWPVVFEGTMLSYGKKNFIALFVVYSLFILMLDVTSLRPHVKKVSGETS